ncbi:MAG: hypothetical protein ACFFB3_11725 [Candidatus Hodarchaeota archaeon]
MTTPKPGPVGDTTKIVADKGIFLDELSNYLDDLAYGSIRGPMGHLFEGIIPEIRETAINIKDVFAEVLVYLKEMGHSCLYLNDFDTSKCSLTGTGQLNELKYIEIHELVDFCARLIQETDDPLQSMIIWQYFLDSLDIMDETHNSTKTGLECSIAVRKPQLDPYCRLNLLKYFLGQTDNELVFAKRPTGISMDSKGNFVFLPQTTSPRVAAHLGLCELYSDLNLLCLQLGIPRVGTILGLEGAEINLDMLKEAAIFGKPPKTLRLFEHRTRKGKFSFNKWQETRSDIVERSPTYKGTFSKDIGCLSSEDQILLIAEWEYKILIYNVFAWLDKLAKNGITELVLFSNEITGVVKVTRINLFNADKYEVYEQVMKHLEDFSRKLGSRHRIGTFGLAPLSLRKFSTEFNGLDVSGKKTLPIKHRFMETISGNSGIAEKTVKTRFWKKCVPKPKSYTALREIETIEELLFQLDYIQGAIDNPSWWNGHWSVRAGRSLVDTSGEDAVVDFLIGLIHGTIQMIYAAGDELHSALNMGGSNSTLAPLVKDPLSKTLVNEKTGKDWFLERLANTKDSNPDLLMSIKREIQELLRELFKLFDLDFLDWRHEHFLGVINAYLLKRGILKKILNASLENNKQNLLADVANVFEDAFSEDPQVYEFLGTTAPEKRIGIGEEFGVRVSGSRESTWIVDHVAVFRIKKGNPDARKYVLFFINDKIPTKASPRQIAKDLRNQYNLMIMNRQNNAGEALILSDEGTDWMMHPKKNLQGDEKNSWDDIVGLMQSGLVVEMYGLYCAMDVVEDVIKGKTFFTIVFNAQVFQPQVTTIRDCIEKMVAQIGDFPCLKEYTILREAWEKIRKADDILESISGKKASHRVIWADFRSLREWRIFANKILRDAKEIKYSLTRPTKTANAKN